MTKCPGCIFTLRFAEGEVPRLAQCYLDNLTEAEKRNEDEIERVVAPGARESGFLGMNAFLAICRWKSPRPQSRCKANDPELVRETTRIALSTPNERLRVEVLTLLQGVGLPTASAILHWCHRDRYPILDFRALESLGSPPGVPYDFELWTAYIEHCRLLATRCRVSMRTLDRALWHYSRERASGGDRHLSGA